MTSNVMAGSGSVDGSAIPETVWMAFRRPIRCTDATVRKWERFSPSDCILLENAFMENISENIDVHFGRYVANAGERWMQAYYWKEARWPIVRGTWFWRDPVDGSVCPFGEADAATLEEAFQDIRLGLEEGPIDCELVDTDVVSGTVQFVSELVATPGKVSLDLPSTVWKITHALYRTTQGRVERLETFRGYPGVAWVPTGEEQLASRVSHLVLCVHGIGEALYNRQNDEFLGSVRFRGNIDIVRENLNEAALKLGDLSLGRIEVLPVEWSECIHSNFLDRRMESVTLPNLKSVRDFANLALTDVFLYTQKDIQTTVSNFAKVRIEKLLEKFHRKNPPVFLSFVGHSLGSVVLYDLFIHDPAFVTPCALFFMGSPLAMFLTIRNIPLSLPLFLNCRLFNIFHPFDAIAYRLEPLIDLRMQETEPDLVHHRGGHRVHVALRKTVSDFRSVIASFGEWMAGVGVPDPRPEISVGPAPPPAVPPQPVLPEHVRAVKNANYNERIDWSLQESAAESVSEWVAAVGSHFTYWKHEDVAAFIVNRLVHIGKIRNQGLAWGL